ncbi:MAG: DUF86 domain-containing protein [Deltaproteobacteria bacterium]|nr:DUF86 domain-containing protein [Deltaproteobacteria bacterium]MBI3294799.1 DUF86 domain-containing protein [Deltaproteobacteria bacterium]
MTKRHESHCLKDIHRSAALIDSFVNGLDFSGFTKDSKTQSAVLYQLAVIGEATKKISNVLRAAHPETPWKKMAGMRTPAVIPKTMLVRAIFPPYTILASDCVWQ